MALFMLHRGLPPCLSLLLHNFLPVGLRFEGGYLRNALRLLVWL